MNATILAIGSVALVAAVLAVPTADATLPLETGPLCWFWFDQWTGTLQVSCKAYGNECGFYVTLSDKRAGGTCDL